MKIKVRAIRGFSGTSKPLWQKDTDFINKYNNIFKTRAVTISCREIESTFGTLICRPSKRNNCRIYINYDGNTYIYLIIDIDDLSKFINCQIPMSEAIRRSKYIYLYDYCLESDTKRVFISNDRESLIESILKKEHLTFQVMN